VDIFVVLKCFLCLPDKITAAVCILLTYCLAACLGVCCLSFWPLSWKQLSLAQTWCLGLGTSAFVSVF